MKKALIPEQSKLVKFLSKQGYVRLAYLFGSVARGEDEKLSDVDVAVLLDDSLDKKEKFYLQLELISGITEILKTDEVDLVVINDAPLSLNYEIIKANCPIFVRDEAEKIDFEHGVLSKYLDMRYYEKRAAAGFLKKVAEKGI